jgi:hypothetical protein
MKNAETDLGASAVIGRPASRITSFRLLQPIDSESFSADSSSRTRSASEHLFPQHHHPREYARLPARWRVHKRNLQTTGFAQSAAPMGNERPSRAQAGGVRHWRREPGQLEVASAPPLLKREAGRRYHRHFYDDRMGCVAEKRKWMSASSPPKKAI